ncbi:MAG TPA: hypothetical protein VHC90_05765 [Bryobacteraceae bacterium]|nr:hypothetical protein [Bryobacteraceae bacterium]
MTARDAFRNGLELAQQSARLMRNLTPGGFLCDWQEFDNKIESFRLFQWVDRELGIPGGAEPQEILAHLPTEENFHTIWVREGVGHLAGKAAILSTQGLLTSGDAGRLPDSALVPLHAGMGTAFAEKVFEGLPSQPSKSDVDRAVRRFVDLCGANCRPGWEDGTVESLGLVVRCLYPHLLDDVSNSMRRIDGRLRLLFWHGVGRGLYFVPANFVPYAGARKRMIANAAEETHVADERRNVLAGLLWAVTLVNLCNPEIVKSAARACSELQFHDEFTNGMISAVLAWHHMVPRDVDRIETYTTAEKKREGDGLFWRYWIATPAREALEEVYPGLERQNRIASLYSYRTVEELRRSGEMPVGSAV